MQLLYVIHQIPINMALKSNDALTVHVNDEEHPIFEFLLYGMRITLGSDDAMVFALTENPVTEELEFIQGKISDVSMLHLKWGMSSEHDYFDGPTSIYQSKFRLQQTAELLATIIPRAN